MTQDIARFDPSVTVADVTNLRRAVEFVGKSAVDGVNYSSVSRSVGITKYKAEKPLDYLVEIGGTRAATRRMPSPPRE